jgi:hypothetical protein
VSGWQSKRVILFCLLVSTSGCRQLLCSDVVLETATSPDGRRAVDVVERNCGATSGSLTMVSVRDQGESFTGEMKDAVLVVMRRSRVRVSWRDGGHLTVKLPESDSVFVKQREIQWKGLSVEHEGLADEPPTGAPGQQK